MIPHSMLTQCAALQRGGPIYDLAMEILELRGQIAESEVANPVGGIYLVRWQAVVLEVRLQSLLLSHVKI